MSELPGGSTPPVESEVSLEEMWSDSVRDIGNIDPQRENWKGQSLPLARIKKIMKSEEFTLQELERERLQQLNPGQEIEIDKHKTKFMISQEAPMLMTKACELLIKELTVRAWQHTERNRRRTLQRADLHAAVGEHEIFDFLIDIVPRITSAGPSGPPTRATAAAMEHAPPPGMISQLAGDGTGFMSLGGGDIAGVPMVHDPNNPFPFMLSQQSMEGTDVNLLLQQQQQRAQQQTHWTTDPPL